MATIIITAFLFSLVAGMQAVEVANADPFLFGVPPLIVNSPPCNPYLTVKPTVSFSFDYYVSKNLTQIDHFTYSLDENANSTLSSSVSDFIDSRNYTQTVYSHYSVSKTLENLSNGNHSVTFYEQFLDGTIIDVWDEKIIVDPNYSNPVPLMISPLNQTTYRTQAVPVIFSVNSSVIDESLYSLDSSSNYPFLIGNGTLPNLSDGPHTLKLIITIETQTEIRYVQYRETVYFNVDTNKTNSSPFPSPAIPLTISILSPENGTSVGMVLGNNTFPIVSFPLIYITNQEPSWVGYSIDGNSIVTVTHNDTLVYPSVLTYSHNLTLYANDTAGNMGKSDTVFFTIDTTTPSPTGQPTLTPSATPNNEQENLTPILIIVGLVVVVLAMAAGALIYLRKRKG